MHDLVTPYFPHQYKGIIRTSSIQVCFTVYSRTRVYYSLCPAYYYHCLWRTINVINREQARKKDLKLQVSKGKACFSFTTTIWPQRMDHPKAWKSWGCRPGAFCISRGVILRGKKKEMLWKSFLDKGLTICFVLGERGGCCDMLLFCIQTSKPLESLDF